MLADPKRLRAAPLSRLMTHPDRHSEPKGARHFSKGARYLLGGASDLVQAVRVLELAARRNVAALAPGNYSTSILGRGLVFHEPRKYVPGQPARHIDWNVTARLGEPYVKIHQEERQREVFVALDVSPSMHTGFQHKTKLEHAVELAATLAVSAVEGGDRFGCVLFADRALAVERPRPGRRQLFRVLRGLLEHTAPWDRPVAESDPRAAIHAVQRLPGRGFVVFVISDFIDHDIPEDLKYVRARHDVSLLHVYDPLEYAGGGTVRFAARAPEGGTQRLAFSPGETGSLEAMEAFLRREAGRHRIAVESFPTHQPVAAALDRFFHRRRRLRR
jgi:uncharacterized protein (DUF58 family)